MIAHGFGHTTLYKTAKPRRLWQSPGLGGSSGLKGGEAGALGEGLMRGETLASLG
jgi:hypothetical protein